MKNKKSQKTVLLGLSGGVDSAVAALLLKKQGYRVIGIFMQCFSNKDKKLIGDCNVTTDKKDAQKISVILNIPIIILNYEKEYRKYVIEPMFKSYALGLTPNPDSLCNKLIKFPFLWKEAKKFNADYIATGHYTRTKKKRGSYHLFMGKDKTKDQSYFLYELKQKDLRHTLFPIENLRKSEVRKIAKKAGFSNWDKRSTRGICFVGKVDMKSFLQQKIEFRRGLVKNPEGEVIGEHNGIMFYTIGERIGEKYGIKINKEYKNIQGKKLYIAGKIKKNNTLIAAPEGHAALLRDFFIISNTNWISGRPKFPLNNVKVRVRHLGELIPVEIQYKNRRYICKLKRAIKGIADGQSAVIYRGKELLGGGEIRFG